VLLHRMKAHKVDYWSRLGRLRRSQWVLAWEKVDRAVMSGRIVCDTYLAAKARADLVKSKSYSLTQLARSQLETPREDISFESIPGYFKSASSLAYLTEHCCFDTFLVIKLMSKLQVLPLTKQLTALAGNLWGRTMTGARAERNEYLLLHEFHKAKFIVPDKAIYTSQRGAGATQQDGDEDGGRKTEGRRKPAYAGGLVLEPKKGFYDKFVLMLDFNSLYPSIIQEYNICFTTVNRPVRSDDNPDDEPDVPDSALETGTLPKLLARLVDRRRQVKQLMKDPKATPTELAQYNIRQTALKLTANSMYGCLGFTNSRFYAKPLAMLITSKGREILQNTVGLAESKGLDVIYGDTDSIMIYTNTDSIDEVKTMGLDLKREVNKRYRLLEIEMDAFYQRMLLLKKKKYAAIVVTEVNGQLKTKMETKGLDLVRRDWCELSHSVSEFALNQILSGDGREEVLDRIHEYLAKVGRETRGGLVPIEKFIINKGMTKNAHEYADVKSQPHVQVAKRMIAKGISVRAGDTVPYVICTDHTAQGPSKTMAECAYHPDELRQPGSGLKIDFEWYLAQQVHPPVARLCAPIEGTDAGRLASCLGLDASRYHVASAVADMQQHTMLDAQISDEERFRNVDRLFVRCLRCNRSNPLIGVALSKVGYRGLRCPEENCGAVLPAPSIGFQLTAAIQQHIRRYQEGWLLCDDPACQTRTRMLSVRREKCMNAECLGGKSLAFSDKMLYNQLLYFDRVFNYDRALKHTTDESLRGMLSWATRCRSAAPCD
ncbi:DNA polymerase family B-domain-containing protein, partial [Thamnocephalis sphaerospora]